VLAGGSAKVELLPGKTVQVASLQEVIGGAAYGFWRVIALAEADIFCVILLPRHIGLLTVRESADSPSPFRPPWPSTPLCGARRSSRSWATDLGLCHSGLLRETLAVNQAERTGDSEHSAIWRYGLAVLLVAAAWALRLALDPILGRRSPFLILPIAILLVARFGGWLPALVATLLSALAGWCFLIRPSFSFTFEDTPDAEDIAVYVISATGISLLGGKLRETIILKTQSEQAAKRSEATVRALLDSAAQVILAVDASGTIVMVNHMTETTFGYKPDELLGQSLDLLLPEEVRSRHREHQKDYFDSPRNRPMGIGLELKARHKIGAIFPVEISLSHVETPTGRLAIAFVTDITQRKHVEEERQKFVSLADRSQEFIGMCDLD